MPLKLSPLTRQGQICSGEGYEGCKETGGLERNFLDLDVLVLFFFVEAIHFFHLFNTNRSDFFLSTTAPDGVYPRAPSASECSPPF